MSFFQQAEGDAAILVVGGVYKQADLFTRDGYLYARYSGGFVRLMADGSTSKAGVRLDYMTWGGQALAHTLGRLCTTDVSKAKPLAPADTVKLLGAPE